MTEYYVRHTKENSKNEENNIFQNKRINTRTKDWKQEKRTKDDVEKTATPKKKKKKKYGKCESQQKQQQQHTIMVFR